MDKKLECVEEYFCSTKAFYLFYLGFYSGNQEYKKYILDKHYLNGTKIAFLSNIMLNIKEDLVDSKGNRIYDSKLYYSALESTVETIATKVENGYLLDNYLFPDAATLVAIVRNKLAHGKYYIDFSHNRVILLHEGQEIKINIKKLMLFINIALSNVLKNNKTKKYERNIVVKKYKEKDDKIRDVEEVKKIIKSCEYIIFSLESTDDYQINPHCIELLERYINYYKKNIHLPLINDEYKKLKEYLKDYNCKLTFETKRISKKQDMEDIVKYAEQEIITNNKMSYQMQLELIAKEVLRRIDSSYNSFNPLLACTKNLYLLDAISFINSTSIKELFNYLDNKYDTEMILSYDEFGMTLLTMFNSLYIYPFEDVFESSREYKSNRTDEFDFSNLDLSMVDIEILNINDIALKEAEQKYIKLNQKKEGFVNRINTQKSNLTKVLGDIEKETKIKNGINGLQNILDNDILPEFNNSIIEYQSIKDDYTNNYMYFKNKAIIEGIRNSIAHGRYEIIPNPNFEKTLIIFNDIYEGNITFKGSINYESFEKLINDNTDIVINYLRAKISCKKM